MRKSRSVLSVGFTALDIILRDGGITHAAGGTAANVAANLAFLGWRSAIAGQVGDDEAAALLATDLRGASVDVTSLRSISGSRTAMVVHRISTGGHRFFFSCPECRRKLPRFRPLAMTDARATLQTWPRPDVYFFDRATPGAVTLATWYRAAGSLVVFEPSRVSYQQHFRAAVATADILKFSVEREASLSTALIPAPAGQLRIVTLGPMGLRFSLEHGNWVTLPAFPVDVVDSGGAGDWATAGLVFALSERSRANKRHVREAATFGQALAAVSCRFPGARGLSLNLSRASVLHQVQAITAGRPVRIASPNVSLTEPLPRRCLGCLAVA